MNAAILGCLSLLLVSCSAARLKRAITPEDKELFGQLVGGALADLQSKYKTIPDINGSSSTLKYFVTNITVSNLVIPGVTITDAGESSLRLSITGAGISAGAAWNIIYNNLPNLKLSGTIAASVAGLNIAVTATVVDLPDGRVKIALTDCLSSVNSISLDFTGSMASFFRLFKTTAQNLAKAAVGKMICSQVREYILKV